MPAGVAVRAPTRATDRGPTNSRVTASPRPTRSMAVYSETFITANTTARPITGTHSPPAERPQPRAAHRQQDHPGHPLAHRDHPDRPDHREGQRADRGSGLAAQ